MNSVSAIPSELPTVAPVLDWYLDSTFTTTDTVSALGFSTSIFSEFIAVGAPYANAGNIRAPGSVSIFDQFNENEVLATVIKIKLDF